MSLGLMNHPAKLIEIRSVVDSEGFRTKEEFLVANIRVYVEGRHGSQKWANLAAFSEATELFRFRAIPGVIVTDKQYLKYNDALYNILSVENIKGRGMYIEVLAKKVETTNG